MRVWIILWNMNISAYYMCFNFFLSKLLLCLSFIWDSKQGIKRNELVSLELELFLRMLWLQRWKWDFKYLHCNCLQLVFDQKNEGKKKKSVIWLNAAMYSFKGKIFHGERNGFSKDKEKWLNSQNKHMQKVL